MNERPKYSIGTRIRLLDELTSSTSAATEFSIIARHFLDTTKPHYRIRSLWDCHEQAVREEDVVPSVDAMSREMGLKIVHFRRPRLSIVN
jgi:hypothetical protein